MRTLGFFMLCVKYASAITLDFLFFGSRPV